MFDKKILNTKQLNADIESAIDMTLIDLQLLYDLLKEKNRCETKKKELLTAIQNLSNIIKTCEKKE